MGKIFLLLIAMILSGNAWCASQPPAPSKSPSGPSPQQTATKSNQETKQEERGTENAPVVVKLANTGKSEQETAEERKHINDKAFIDRVTAIATVILAAFTVILAFISFWQARISSNTARRQLRAYIGIDEDTRQEVDQRFIKGRFLFHAVVENFGQTPASEIGYKVVIKYLSDKTKIKYPNPREVPLGPGILNPGQKFFLKFEVFDFHTKKELAEIYNPNSEKHFYIYGCAVYKDIFGRLQYTNFCARLEWKLGRRRKPAWMLCHENNDAS